MSRSHLSRRTLLRGAGACLALPALEAMSPRSLRAQEESIQRLFLYYFPNGWPFDGGWGYDGPYQPVVDQLADIREDFSCLWGMTNEKALEHEEAHGAHDGHGKTACTVMNGQVPSNLGNKLFGIPTTADQVLASQLYSDWKFSSLGVNVYPVGTIDSFHQPIHTNNIFWKGPNDPVKLYENPRELFDLLFADFTPDGSVDPTAAERRARKKSILDFVSSDLARVTPRVSAADRHRLDEYLTSIRQIEQDIESAPPASNGCSPSGEPASEGTTLETYASRYDAHLELAVKAFECDLTRIFQFMVGNETMFPSYLGGASSDWHSYSHDNYGECARVVAWHAERFKGLVSRLKQSQDIDGNTLLHNSTLVFFTAQGDSGSHVTWNLNALVAGQGGGTLNVGSDLRVGGEITNLWLTILQAYGVPLTSFGSSQGAISSLRAS